MANHMDISDSKKSLKQAALNYHSMGRKGKIEVKPTKPFNSQRDLSLAYTPGVAEPCLEIHKDPATAREYTAKGNLVAVISNGTAVLGLGNIGALAGKPVMEGKGILFKRFADIDVFDLELDTEDPDKFIQAVKLLEPTFGGINLEDIKAPECFYIEEQLTKEMNIPVFHDDQHGTAIISGAGLLNAVELVGKKLEEVKIVISGAGAAGIACANLYIDLGAKIENIYMVDSKGVLCNARGDSDGNKYKKPFYKDTECKSLENIMIGADVFVGLSKKDLLSPEMVKTMADNPIIFAMANPDPEITYPVAKAARPDAIVATGRSDFPNQVNNVLGFPFIFRGTLDVEAVTINKAMKLACARALAQLAKEDVPDEVKRKYNDDELIFGPDYIIPKPFDPRVLYWAAPAVAKAAMDTGVARKHIDIDAYVEKLKGITDWSRDMMRKIYDLARKNKKRIVFAEGDHPKIVWAAAEIVEEGIGLPVLLVENKEEAIARFEEHNHSADGIEFIEYMNSPLMDEFVLAYFNKRNRKGVTMRKAKKDMQNVYFFSSMMVEMGYADSMVAGINAAYPYVLSPALRVIGANPGDVVSGIHFLNHNNHSYFITDCAVNELPNACELTDIVIKGIETVEKFRFKPVVAMLSYTNFGSVRTAETEIIEEVIARVKEKRPDVIIDGPVQADLAITQDRLLELYPFTELKQRPNLLVFPNLMTANISMKLIKYFGNVHMIGPIMAGFRKPVHLVTRGSEVSNIVNLAAISAVDAQSLENKA
ncbi:MAG TPA: NADP-dependent malic enzyme [Saprospiraceae bacterium]|nr:NADP-dependent malic enzyme [Saprospiraceae bacterium]